MSLEHECLAEKSINRSLMNKPFKGQVFSLASNHLYPPPDRKKLTNREVRDAVDKSDLWFYIPPWQLPRVEFTCLKCRQISIRNTPMTEIIFMAKKNLAFNGILGDLKISIPHFGKAKIKSVVIMKNARKTDKKSRNIDKKKEREKNDKLHFEKFHFELSR
ncbi:uncharacterized protein LOC117171553 [Belonocnema kinseyi]|uniref:uncharacterized protein LOC117171553 n=1 Tax=Belonocnema kinseyi TaxID=2817044 RepID=UPI00143D4BC0|nr:uncharacterized protein LOC117171553 [Belonocnema kinseyi]